MTIRRPALLDLLKIAFTAVVLTVLFVRVDLGQVRHQLATASPPLALAAFALLMLRNVVLAWRWGRVLRAWERPLPVVTLLRLVLVGAFFTLTMPTAAGGDVARWALVPRHRVGRLIAAQSVLCDRLIGLAGLGAPFDPLVDQGASLVESAASGGEMDPVPGRAEGVGRLPVRFA